MGEGLREKLTGCSSLSRMEKRRIKMRAVDLDMV